jgi:hypothetical protein
VGSKQRSPVRHQEEWPGCLLAFPWISAGGRGPGCIPRRRQAGTDGWLRGVMICGPGWARRQESLISPPAGVTPSTRRHSRLTIFDSSCMKRYSWSLASGVFLLHGSREFLSPRFWPCEAVVGRAGSSGAAVGWMTSAIATSDQIPSSLSCRRPIGCQQVCAVVAMRMGGCGGAAVGGRLSWTLVKLTIFDRVQTIHRSRRRQAQLTAAVDRIL